jgi:hypothetical protein
VAALLVGARLIFAADLEGHDERAEQFRRTGPVVCAASLPVSAASSTPGSVEPADATTSNPPPPAATDNSAAAPEKAATAEKNVKKAKMRKHRYRYARYRTWRHGFIIPPPQYWFRPWPRYRAYRGHRRTYAGFPFYFGFRW